MITYFVLFFQVTLVLTENLSTPLQRYARSIDTKNCLFNMCDQSDYPEDEIKALVEKDTRFSSIFGDIIEPFKEGRSRIMFPAENICDVRQVTMYPQYAKNIFKQNRVIVNVPGYHQGVIFEHCVYEGKPCIDEEHLPTGFRTKCQQQYVKVRMVSITEEGRLIQDYFAIPSGCTCAKFSIEF